jgi:hypothetical protein
MRLLYVIPLVLALSGCSHFQSLPETVTEVRIVKKDIPADMLVIPDPVPVPDPKSISQSDVAKFLIRVYARMEELEAKLVEIAKIMKDDK